MDFFGNTLDFGGGRVVGYYDMLLLRIKSGTYESVNINPKLNPTYLVKADEKIPVHDKYYDIVLSMNTLEHVYNIDFYMGELTRVLKDGGKMIITVPFIFRVHGSPDDFSRFTDSWWNKKLDSLGFVDIKVQPLVWDPLVTAISVIENPATLHWRIIRYLVPLRALIKDFIINLFCQRSRAASNQKFRSNYPVGYVITGKKNIETGTN